LKIVIFGLTISSSWGNGHATLWRGLCSALSRRGHSVVFYERDVPYYADTRDWWEWARFYNDWEEALPQARRDTDAAEVAIVTSYCPDALAATGLILDSKAALKVFYDLDSPITLARLDSGETVPWVGERGYRDFDLVLSYAGGIALEKLRSVLGAKNVAPLYGSVDPEKHRPASACSHPGTTLTYMGTYSADRDRALNDLFIEPARQLPGRRFLIGGSKYGNTFPWLPNIFYSDHVAPAGHAAFYRSAPLTLNVTRGPMVEIGYCPSGRLFEAAACGTAVLSDFWQGIGSFYAPDEEILIARDTDEAMAALCRPAEELARVGLRARERTLACHTAEHRAREFEELCGA
jgi:spore maturation protein CgeB